MMDTSLRTAMGSFRRGDYSAVCSTTGSGRSRIREFYIQKQIKQLKEDTCPKK